MKKKQEDLEILEYVIEHKRRGCYEVTLVNESIEAGRYKYLTNFKSKKSAKKFIEEHKNGNVLIDPGTNIPTPDF